MPARWRCGGYSIDSRTVGVGELFFAVRGERHDGHDFVEAALRRGAVAAVVSRARVATLPDEALAAPLLIAEDPLLALAGAGRACAPPVGPARCGRYGLGRQDHHQGSRGRGLGREVQCAQVPRQSEQRIRPAAATAAPGAGARDRGGRDGHEPPRRDCGPGAHCRARLGRGDQCGHGAH